MKRRLFPQSTAGLVAAISIALTIATLGLGFAMKAIVHEELESQLDHRIAAETNALLASSRGDLKLLASLIDGREDGHRADGLGYMLVDRDGRHLAGGIRATAPPPGWHEYLTNAPKGEEPELMQSLVTQVGSARLVVGVDRAPIDNIDQTIIALTMGALGAMLVFGIVSAGLLGIVVRRRLAKIVDAAEAIIAGDRDRRVARDGSDSEFDRVSATLNQLLDRNAELIENLRQVSSDVAHDLRTPLSRQQQLLEEALTAPRQAESDRETLEALAVGGRDMLELFAAILRISEIDTFAVREHFQPVDLAEIVERVTDAYRPIVEGSGHRLKIEATGPVVIQGDRSLLTQLVANLIENGLRHTPPGTLISVSTMIVDDQALLTVADNGPGIESVDRDRVLQRFVRLERSRSTPGNGLGLSLVQSVVRAHRAELDLNDNWPGLSVEATFALDVRFTPAE